MSSDGFWGDVGVVHELFRLAQRRYQPEWIPGKYGIAFTFMIQDPDGLRYMPVFLERDGDELVYLAKGFEIQTKSMVQKFAMYDSWLKRSGNIDARLDYVVKTHNGKDFWYLKRSTRIVGDPEENAHEFIETLSNIVHRLTNIEEDLADIQLRYEQLQIEQSQVEHDETKRSSVNSPNGDVA